MKELSLCSYVPSMTLCNSTTTKYMEHDMSRFWENSFDK